MEQRGYQVGDNVNLGAIHRLSERDPLHRPVGNIINTLTGKTAFVARAKFTSDELLISNQRQGDSEPYINQHSNPTVQNTETVQHKAPQPREATKQKASGLTSQQPYTIRMPISMRPKTMSEVKSKYENQANLDIKSRNPANPQGSCKENISTTERKDTMLEKPNFFELIVNAIFGDSNSDQEKIQKEQKKSIVIA